jgi:hypothetical protein
MTAVMRPSDFWKSRFMWLQQKKPAITAAGVLSNSISMKSEHHPSRAGMMMVMMPGNGGCSHKLPI